MSKNLKLFFVYCFIISGVTIAWKSLSANFFGNGVNFVLLLFALALMLVLICTDNQVKKRTLDLFVVSCAITALELIQYLALEIFNSNLNYTTLKGFNVYQSVISFLSLIFFVYFIFRLILEVKGKQFVFIETMLGNSKREKKVKKAKELSNGSLMEKPSKNRQLGETSNFANVQHTQTQPEQTKPDFEQNELDSEQNELDSEQNKFDVASITNQQNNLLLQQVNEDNSEK